MRFESPTRPRHDQTSAHSLFTPILEYYKHITLSEQSARHAGKCGHISARRVPPCFVPLRLFLRFLYFARRGRSVITEWPKHPDSCSVRGLKANRLATGVQFVTTLFYRRKIAARKKPWKNCWLPSTSTSVMNTPWNQFDKQI